MDGINFIQDLAIVLLAAGLAGFICKRFGLSVIVGYLAAGILIGPYTPPFSFIMDVDRIQTLSQVGLVFLMFAIGLGLSLTKLGRMGLPVIVATALAAFAMLNLTRLLGEIAGWSTTQSLFMAGIFMVSSSAVIAKIVHELHLGHEHFAQRALTMTVLEDVVAVVMLTILAAHVSGTSAGDSNVGGMLTTLGAFVALAVSAGLLLVPRLLRRLDARADPELQTIIVAGVLFLLAISAAKAGYSLALGAFLLGAIVAEMPQRSGVERSFAGMRDLFSSVFFVSIGMLINVRLLADVWLLSLGLAAFVLIARPFVTGLALMAVGTPARQARRAGLLLSPLGEFSFVIAQMGVAAHVLPPSYYPLAVGVSLITLFAAPIVNRNAPAILRLTDRFEPDWLQRALAAYQSWIKQVQTRRSMPLAWKLIRTRLLQVGLEMLLITGVLIFSRQLLRAMEGTALAERFESAVFTYIFWSVIGIVVLIPLVAIWRNVSASALIAAESLEGGSRLTAPLINNVIRAAGVLLLGYWLYSILPFEAFSGWGWIVIAALATVVVAFFSRRLIYWHSTWQSSVAEVLTEASQQPGEARERARADMGAGLEDWALNLEEVIVPDTAPYAGKSLSQLAIPAHFGCSIIEVERNGHVITTTGPDLRLYPGDKILLLGQPPELKAARGFLGTARPLEGRIDEFEGSVLETFTVPPMIRGGQTLAELPIAKQTGVRVAAIKRGRRQIINPTGADALEPGDELLVVGTLAELRAFRHWLREYAAT